MATPINVKDYARQAVQFMDTRSTPLTRAYDGDMQLQTIVDSFLSVHGLQANQYFHLASGANEAARKVADIQPQAAYDTRRLALHTLEDGLPYRFAPTIKALADKLLVAPGIFDKLSKPHQQAYLSAASTLAGALFGSQHAGEMAAGTIGRDLPSSMESLHPEDQYLFLHSLVNTAAAGETPPGVAHVLAQSAVDVLGVIAERDMAGAAALGRHVAWAIHLRSGGAASASARTLALSLGELSPANALPRLLAGLNALT
jgi:hypothetical protein